MAKKLLFITPMFPLDQSEDIIVPFITHFTKDFADKTDVEVDVIALMFPKTRKYRYGNVTVYPIGSGYKKSIWIVPYLVIAIVKGIRLQRKNKYDGILCFWYRECAFIGKFVSRLFNIKLRIWMQGQDVKKENKYIRLLQLPESEIIMLSEHQKIIFRRNFNLDISTIANVAVDMTTFPTLNQNERTITILGAGNLSVLKNYALFIDIVNLLKKENPAIRTVICGGDTGDKNALKKKILDLNLSDNVTLAGSISHQEVLGYMNESVVFLHTSSFEGGGAVLHEALYSGCFVASTIPIKDSESLETFFYSEDKFALVKKIQAVLSEPHRVKRVEKFKMEDTLKTVYDSFYQ